MDNLQDNTKQNILIITASGGGGLIQAARAKEQQIKKTLPNARLYKVDLMRKWVCKIIGLFGIKAWDTAQMKGDVWSQESLVWFQSFAEILVWPQIFYHALKTIAEKKITRIIDTQPLGTSAIIKAIRFYNKLSKKNLVLEKVIVDLPTYQSTHFFKAVKRLSKRDKKALKILTIEPLLDENQTEAEFWEKCAKISVDNVVYDEFPVRRGFLHFKDKTIDRSKDFDVITRVDSLDEKNLIKKIVSKGNLKVLDVLENQLKFTILPKDFLITLMLGSKPCFSATFGYVNQILDFAKKIQTTKDIQIKFFVFCFDYKNDEKCFFNKISNLIENCKNYPKNLTIIPMSFQYDDVIAPLFYRSDVTITRSGGQTIMELMATKSLNKWIHSEAKLKKGKSALEMKDLLKGIPAWEAGNATYLRKKVGGEIVTPEIFHTHLEKLF
jgi:hypothetical protein